MAGFRDRYSTDRSAEEAGVWVDYGDGLKVQVRRLNSKHSRETRRRLEKPYATQFRNRDMPESLQEKLLNQQMAESIVNDQKRILPCSVWLEGEYGQSGLFLGVPCKLGRRGLEGVVEVDLTADERDALARSADAVREPMASLSI